MGVGKIKTQSLRITVLLAIFCQPVWAANTQDQELIEQETAEQETADSLEPEDSTTDLIPAAIPQAPNVEQVANEEVIIDADTEEQDSIRFIPTEEISQDLGVSFPVDI